MSYSIAVFGRRRIAAAAFAVTVLATSPALAAGSRLGSRVLHKGMRGPDVAALQRDLTASGIWTFPSGVFSEGTQIHVKRFQRANRLPADGVVGPMTVHRLQWAMRRYARTHHRAATTTAAPQSNATTSSDLSSQDGGTSMAPPPSDAPVENATLNSQGLAVPPSDAPPVIREIIAAANKIAFKPYVYGGGHSSWDSTGYDCSGSVSYALHGGGLLSTPYDSTQFESYGARGAGRWITIYADGGHAYMTIAGLTFDTVNQQSSNNNDRWSTAPAAWEQSQGYTVVHPKGW